ncbi:MAG TPA: ATP-binding protein [Candidatus Saccharimonadales bacterium]|nr:ATP-binding protein [Candidatus Saccharimonadales bacterium]
MVVTRNNRGFKIGLALHTYWRRQNIWHGITFVCAVLAIAALLAVLTTSISAEQANITEYPTPTSNSQPSSMVRGPDGKAWFTENNADKIGTIATNGTITEYTVPSPNSEPVTIANGPDGNMWFVGVDPNTADEKPGKITTGGTVTVYPIPTASQNLSTPAAGPDGNMWFTEFDNNKIAKITPGGTVTEYAVPTPSTPTSIRTGSDGNLWFTEQNADKVGRITPGGVITEFNLPSSATTMSLLTLGSDGNLWFEQQGPTAIDRVTTSGVITQYAIPSATSGVGGLTLGTDGDIWFTGDSANVGKIDTSGNVTEYSTTGTTPALIAAGPDGNMWFTGTSSGNIGRVTPSGTVTLFPTPTTTPQAITAAADGNIYFTDNTHSEIGILDLLPTITSAPTRPTTYGTRIALAGHNFANVSGVTLDGAAITQTPCPTTPTSPCYTIESDTALTIRTTTSVTSAENVQLTNAWGQGAATPVSPLETGITAAGTFTPYFIEPGDRSPYSVTKGPDGNTWFTEQNPDTVARIDANGQITEFPLSNGSSGIGVITTGPDGNLWFTEGNTNQIGRITPTGTITEFAIPTSASGPGDITAGPDGNVWFAEYSGSQVAKITPSGVVTEYPVSAAVLNVTLGPDGNIWFAEQGGTIGKMTTSGVATTYTSTATTISSLAPGPDGNVWFTDSNNDKIGRITPTGTITEFPVTTANSYPLGVTAGPDGNLWFTENSINQIGSITPSGTVTEYQFSSANDYGVYIATNGNGLWFTTSDSIDELAFPTPPPSGGGGTGGGSGTGTGTGSTGTSGGSSTTKKGTDTTTTPPPSTTPTTTPTDQLPAITDLSQISDFTNGQGYDTGIVTGQQFTFVPAGTGQQYTITVGAVTPTDAQLSITPPAGSPAQAVTLPADQPKSVDVTNDNKPDISFTATQLANGRGHIKFALYRTPGAGAGITAHPVAVPSNSWVKRIPRVVLIGFPYLLFLILAGILAGLTHIIWRENKATNALRAFYRLQADVAAQKETFIQLASHYLRTPLTMIAGGIELAEAGGESAALANNLQAKAKELRQQTESLLAGIATNAGDPAAALQPTNLSIWETAKRPVFFMPVIILALTVAAFYKLLLLAGAGQLAHTTALVQVGLLLLLSVGLYALLRGLRLRRKEQSELQRALAMQTRLDRQRNEFIAGAAATLRPDTEELSRAVRDLPTGLASKSAQEGAKRLTTILDKFELAKDLQLAPEPTALQSLTFSALWQQIGATLETAKQRGVQVALPADGTIVVRDIPIFAVAVSSVLDNAITYSPSGGTVDVAKRIEPKALSLAITDHGQGMPSEQAAHWFQPFNNPGGALQFEHEGIGLSLYLDHLIMTYLGGDIGIASAPGEGTTVTLSLAQ